MKMLEHTKALIIDNRIYPSLDFRKLVMRDFLHSDLHFLMLTVPMNETAGLFYYKRLSRDPYKSLGFRTKHTGYDGDIVILVNDHTQSAGEYITMALQIIPNTTVIGSQTAGADGNVSKISLPGNISTAISGLGVYYPDGTETQRVGVKIDRYVEPTIAGIKARKDELLEKALEMIEHPFE